VTDAPLGALLVMLKPDREVRTCTSEEARRLREAWADFLAFLRGAAPDELTHADLIGLVAQKAALRMIRFQEYDIRAWARQAATLDPDALHAPDECQDSLLSDLVSVHLKGVGFTPGRTSRTWLNRVTIELLYRDAPRFDENRDMLVGHLLNGPVTIQHWYGQHDGLALAFKLLTRHVLSSAQLTNFLHIETMTAERLDLIDKSLAPA
jgi:hypothetical protein